MDPQVRAAISVSHLRDLPPGVLTELMTGAVSRRIRAGEVTHRQGEVAPHLELVVSGVVRVFVAATDGRTLTVRYCRTGALIGTLSLFTQGFSMPASTQALVDAELLSVAPSVARRLALRDARVARAFLEELSDRATSFIYEIPGSAFATVRQRVGRHLLDLAAENVQDPRSGRSLEGTEIPVPVSQGELAAAVGTVREVVVRVLREMRDDGVVRTERDRIVILDPSRLIREQGWNPGS